MRVSSAGLGALAAVAAAVCVSWISIARGQSASPAAAPDAEFHFVRLIYTNANTGGFGRRRRRSWLTDYPEAEVHLLQGLTRLTRIDIGSEGLQLDLSNDRFMDYPFLYAVEVGHWSLDDAEAARLREYLMRGGFLLVDDFWGTQEWSVFIDSMQRVFPDRPIVEIAEDDEILHILYDLNEQIQIPGSQYEWSGVTYEKDGYVPHWRGIYDDDGRLMVAINFNMDMGDAWEHADDPAYPEPMTTLAYRYAVNYAIYAMSH